MLGPVIREGHEDELMSIMARKGMYLDLTWLNRKEFHLPILSLWFELSSEEHRPEQWNFHPGNPSTPN